MIASTLGLIGIPVSASIIITTLLLLYASHGDAVINKYVYMGFILLILAIIAFSARMDYLFYERTKSRMPNILPRLYHSGSAERALSSAFSSALRAL